MTETHDETTPTEVDAAPTHDDTTSEAEPSQTQTVAIDPARAREQLARLEKIVYARVFLGVVLYVAFATIDIAAVVTRSIDERAGLLLVLLVCSIVALPRTVWPDALVLALPRPERDDWVDRTRRLQRWLVTTRVIFFLGALVLFLGLPELI